MEKIKVIVRDRSGVVFDGEVDAVSSANPVGNYDVLPFHSNFITTVSVGVTIHDNGRKIREIPVEKGILRVKSDAVEIYLGP